jgi:hypothetical protein
MKKIILLILMMNVCLANAQSNAADSLDEQIFNVEDAKLYLERAASLMSDNDSNKLAINLIALDLGKIVESLKLARSKVIVEASPNLGGGEVEQGENNTDVMPEEEEAVMIEEVINESEQSTSALEKMNPMRKLNSAFVIETGVNRISGNLNSSDIKLNNGGSWFWSYSLTKQFVKSKSIDLEIGIAYHKNRFKFSNEVALEDKGESSRFKVVADAEEDTKLHVGYLAIPLLSSIHLSKKANLYIGATLGYRVFAKQYIERKNVQEQIREERKSDYGLNDWTTIVKAGLGYKKFDIIGQYHFSNLFASKTNYDFKVFSIGTMFRI